MLGGLGYLSQSQPPEPIKAVLEDERVREALEKAGIKVTIKEEQKVPIPVAGDTIGERLKKMAVPGIITIASFALLYGIFKRKEGRR